MRPRVRLATALLAASVSLAAPAGEAPVRPGWAAVIYDLETLAVSVEDETRDDCIADPSGVRRAAEAALRRNGFAITEVSPRSADFVVRTIGHQFLVACAVHVQVFVRRPLAVELPGARGARTIHGSHILVNYALLTTARETTQAAVEKFADEMADALAADVARARRALAPQHPELLQPSAAVPGSAAAATFTAN